MPRSPLGLPVLPLVPCVYMLSPLPRQVRETKSLVTNPSTSAFPKFRVGRLLHYGFRGLFSVHSRYGLQTRQVALCDPLHRRLRRLCCLHRRSDCYLVERSSSRAGLSPAVVQRLFTAHRNRLIYKRECQGKYSPLDRKRGTNCSISAAASLLVATTPISL